MAQQIFVGSVISYDSSTGNYFIRLNGSSLDTLKGVPARLLSPIAFEDGGGVRSAPTVPRDSQCLVLKDGNRHYILGFLQPHGLVANGDAKPTRDVSEGEMFLTHKTRSKIGFSNIGTIVLAAQRWASAALNPVTQQLTAFFKNMRINLYSMIIDYFYNTNDDSGTFRILLTKYLESSIPKPTGVGRSHTLPPDRLSFRAGQLDDDHIMELKIEQGILNDSTPPEHSSSTLVGKQKDGTYFSHKVSTGKTPADAVKLDITAANNTLELNFEKSDKKIKTTLDVAGDNAVVLSVNGATLTIKHDGNVEVKTADPAKILLGGQNKEQRLVTEKFVRDIFEKHMHSNGNQGAPTGKPILPPIIDVNIDSNTGPFTFTTKAE